MGEEMRDVAESKAPREEVVRMASSIVAAYLKNNTLSTDQIPNLIRSVVSSLGGLENGGNGEDKSENRKPAVSIKKSITPDYLICLEDGKKLKMLKRHLRATYNLTPEEYRAKWGLPADYPMVAPNYADQRSEFAKKIGLGKHPAPGRGRKPKAA
jgi:predicted transcriptional regulator